MSLSSVRSDTALRSRLFSSSSSFRRLTCSIFSPPNDASDSRSPRSHRAAGSPPSCLGPARPEHPPGAASRRSLRACIASLPLQSSLMSKTYLKSDHFNGGGSSVAEPQLVIDGPFDESDWERASRPLQPIRKDLVIRFRRQRLAREAIMAAKEISVKKYVVRLSGEERERLETLLRKGKSPARRVLKARILLKADVSEAGKGWSDNRIIEALETSPSMVYRVRKQLVEEGFEAVLSRKPRAMPAVARIFDGEKEAKLIALACSKPPKGRARWTLRLLENKVVELGIVDRASDSTIGRALKKTLFSPIAASTGSSRRRPTARS